MFGLRYRGFFGDVISPKKPQDHLSSEQRERYYKRLIPQAEKKMGEKDSPRVRWLAWFAHEVLESEKELAKAAEAK